MLTDVYAFRKPGTGIAPPNGPAIIRPGTATLPSLLQEAGYRTSVIGKWHLGFGDQKPDWNGKLAPGPLEIRFDEAFLLPTTNDRVPQVYVENHHVLNLDPDDPLTVSDSPIDPDEPTGVTHRHELKMDWLHGHNGTIHNGTIHNGISRIGYYTGGQAARFRDEDLADMWVERSRAFIAENKDRPFFLLFNSHDNHVPRMPHERFQGTSGTGYRGDAVIQLDWCVGEIMKVLDEYGLTENTLVVFTSDNGPVLDGGYKDGAVSELGAHEPSGPFSGGKYTVFEGGTRVPFITRWPGTITPGVSDEMVCTIDFVASFAALAGVSLPGNAAGDSINALPALLGEEGAKGREELLTQGNGIRGADDNFGLRIGDWQLIRNAHPIRPWATVSQRPFPPLNKPHTLYYLPDDPGEQNDLGAEHPERLQAMIARLDAIIADGRTRP